MPTVSIRRAAGRSWDIVVIGAGVAGSVVAYELARSGAEVLLVDRATFPREKVCGCCLSAHAVATLHDCGLGDVLTRCGAQPLGQFQLCWRDQQIELPTRGGAALTRASFDAALVESAIDFGAEFLSGANAIVDHCQGGFRHVLLTCDGETFTARARVVVAADGLSGHSLTRLDGFASSIDPRARIGAHAILSAADDDQYPDGQITMVCGRGAYVGLVRLEENQLNVAGAFDVSALRTNGGPGALAAQVLRSAGLPIPVALTSAPWHGTPRMTHRRKHVAGERLLVIGDSAGYVEPFTGEGMAWAIQSALLAAPIALDGLGSWSRELTQRWTRTHRRAFRNRQRLCYITTRLLRHPVGLAAMFAALRVSPRFAKRLVHFVHGRSDPAVLTPQMQSTY